MDLNLVTGQPGASKTLNTLSEVEKRRNEEARPVFYANIKGLKLPWTAMDEPEALQDNPDLITPHSWWNAPEGAIIVIDEAQDYFPAISQAAKQPDYIMKMAKFRHYGYSMYLITQGPALINRNIREWVQPHTHYRRIWGGMRVAKYVNEKCIDNPRSSSVYTNAIRSIIKIDKSMFGKYESAVMHNEHKRVNLRLWLYLLAPLLVIPLAVMMALKAFHRQADDVRGGVDDAAAVEAPLSVSGDVPPEAVGGVKLMPEQQTFDPIVAYQPRIEGMPETAPAYDELRRPVDFPRPNCLRRKQRCECYTQQGTLMRDYPRDLCIAYVKRGYFDPTRPRASGRDVGVRDEAAQRSR